MSTDFPFLTVKDIGRVDVSPLPTQILSPGIYDMTEHQVYGASGPKPLSPYELRDGSVHTLGGGFWARRHLIAGIHAPPMYWKSVTPDGWRTVCTLISNRSDSTTQLFNINSRGSGSDLQWCVNHVVLKRPLERAYSRTRSEDAHRAQPPFDTLLRYSHELPLHITLSRRSGTSSSKKTKMIYRPWEIYTPSDPNNTRGIVFMSSKARTLGENVTFKCFQFMYSDSQEIPLQIDAAPDMIRLQEDEQAASSSGGLAGQQKDSGDDTTWDTDMGDADVTDLSSVDARSNQEYWDMLFDSMQENE